MQLRTARNVVVAAGILTMAAPGAAQVRSLLVNGGFERGLSGWESGNARTVERTRIGGRCLEIRGPGGARQDVLAQGLSGTFTVAVDVETAGIRAQDAPGYAYAAIYQLRRDGELAAFHDFVQLSDAAPWQRRTWTFQVVPGAAVISVRCGVFNAEGTARFDNWTLVPGPRPAARDEVREPQPFTGSERGRVAVFREPGFPAGPGAAKPERLADIVRPAVESVEFLDADALSDPTVLRPDRFDLVILPYGENFPEPARTTFIRYLHGGGDFLSVGGYAFSNLFYRRESGPGWISEKTYLAAKLARAMALENSLLADGGFEKSETRSRAPQDTGAPDARWWRNSETCRIVPNSAFEGKWCARVSRAGPETGPEVKWEVRLPVNPGRRYRIQAAVRTRQVSGPGFAYLAVYQYAADGKLLKFKDFSQVRGTTPWKRVQFDLTPAPGVRFFHIKCGLYRAGGTAWFDDFRLGDITGCLPTPMNTRSGLPKDGLVVGPDQIGVFDADYRLKRVARVQAAAGQDLFPAGVRLGPARGWAASGVRGTDATRWTALLAAVDRYGRSRGAAAALMRHYSGFFSGSSWAFFGIDNQDIFSDPDPGLVQGMGRLVQSMVRGLYLRNLETDSASYSPGAEVRIRVTVENVGCRPRRGKVRWRITPENGDGFLRQGALAFAVEPGRQTLIEQVARLPDSKTGLYRVVVELDTGHGREDRMETGFVALSGLGSSDRSPLDFRDNYLRLGKRPLFLFGSDNYGNVYQSSTESPLWWAREHRASRDFGFQLYENLQYSNAGHRMTERDWRRFRAMTWLTQEQGLVFMPGMLIGHNVAVSDAEIAAQARQCTNYAEQLSAAPRLLWYINGDYRLQHKELDMLRAKWNRFLQQRYATDEVLRQAWAPAVPDKPLGQLDFPPRKSRRWTDVPAMDLTRFQVQLTSDWNRTHVAAIRSVDRRHPITSEYYSTPFDGIDLRLTIDGQDISNIGFFDRPGRDLEVLPLRLRWNDLRARGKSLGLGEYGVKTHPAWAPENGGTGYHIRRTDQQARELFMTVALCSFGMGASRVQNWCLRDSNQRVFPWGVFHPGPLVPKDVAFTHRNLSLLLRLFSPRYRTPPVTVLLCDNMRFGNRGSLGVNAGYRAFEALFGLHVDFNVLGDSFLAELPETTRTIIYPAALCPGDAAIARLKEWVVRGGRLLVTGDFSYDENRRHTRASRLPSLAGVEWVAPRYAVDRDSVPALIAKSAAPGSGVPVFTGVRPQVRVRARGAEVLAAGPDGLPVLTRRRLGRGSVVFFTDPLEIGPDPAPVRQLYAWFLEQAGVSGYDLEPARPDLFAFVQPTRTGKVHVLVERAAGKVHINRFRTAAGQVRVGTQIGWPAMAAVANDGRFLAGCTTGELRLEGRLLLQSAGAVAAASLDGRDLRKSRAVLILPFSEGRVQVAAGRAGFLRNRVILLGDVHNGRFRVFEQLPAGRGGMVSVNFDADRATLLGLCCPTRERDKWVQVLNRWIATPEEYAGY